MRILITSLLFLSFSSGLMAQSVQRITLEEAVELALENNTALIQAENRMMIQEANVTAARANFLPNLNANFGGQRNTGRQFVQETLQFDDRTTRGLSGSVSTNVVIFDGLRNINSLRAARATQLSSEENLQRLKENVIFNTASAYLLILLNEELLSIAKENLVSSQKQLEQIKAQVEVGMRPMVDLYNQEAIVARNEFDIIQQENALNISKIQLLRILAVDPLKEYEFVTPGIDEDKLYIKDFSLAELINEALANRVDLRSTRTQIDISKYNLTTSRGAYLPTVSLGANLSGAYSDQFIDPTTGNVSPFLDQFTDLNRRYSLSFNVQIPIFNRYQTTRQVQVSKVEYKNAVLELESKKLEIYQDVRQAYNDYLSYAKQLETTERALLAASKAFETEQERYRVGASTLIELTRANAEFVSASSNRVQAIYRFVFQEKLLEYSLGLINMDF